MVSERWHATAIALGQAAVLIVGPSGSGKSDLALRCISPIAGHRFDNQFHLVSDDQTCLRRDGDNIIVFPPVAIAGKLEVRGVGIINVNHLAQAHLRLLVRLTANQPERFPDDDDLDEQVLGCPIRRIWLRPFEASADVKLALSLQQVLTT